MDRKICSKCAKDYISQRCYGHQLLKALVPQEINDSVAEINERFEEWFLLTFAEEFNNDIVPCFNEVNKATYKDIYSKTIVSKMNPKKMWIYHFVRVKGVPQDCPYLLEHTLCQTI